MIKTTVKDAYNLNELLKIKYGKRLDSFLKLSDIVEGTLDSKWIKITFVGDEFLLISTNATSRDVLDELQPIITEVMGGQEPICSYDFQKADTEEKDAIPTIEWDVSNPEIRIKNIVNGSAFSDGTKIFNLKLYNSKDPGDFIESEKEKTERIKNTKIYGIYPGSCDPNVISDMSEADLFLQIDAQSSTLCFYRHAISDGKMKKFDLTEQQYTLEYMVYQTTKFGVEIPEPTINKHLIRTSSFTAWYNFWSNHFKRVLSERDINAYQKARKAGKDVTKYLPNGSWKDLLEQQELKKGLK